MNRYTDEDRIRILAGLEEHGWNVNRTARALALPRTTIRRARDRARPELADPEKPQPEFAELFAKAVRLYAQGVIDEFETIHGRDRAIVMGILVDKHLDYRDGRRQTGVSVNTGNQSLVLPPGTTLDDLRALRDGLHADP